MKSWDEQPFAEVEGNPKLTRASGSDLYHGEMEGEARFEYLIMYRNDGTASTVVMERVVGRLGDRSGSFVLQPTGAFESGAVNASWSVVPGSGTGELHGLRGEGTLYCRHGQSSLATLDYDIA